ncbi:kinase-like domain-containing protein [Nemania serpens]|nr:kinase-like domain-containing protein [Nemania serpens]
MSTVPSEPQAHITLPFSARDELSVTETRPQTPTTILRAKYVTNFDEKEFLPRSELAKIMTQDIFRTALQDQLQCSTEEFNKIIATISSKEPTRRCIKIFAILVLSTEELRYIGDFIDKKLCDNQLPLKYEKLRRLLPSCRTAHLDNFCDRQWRVHVPIFDFSSNELRKVRYENDVIFPFIERKSKSRGGHGAVWEVRIHSDHFRGFASNDGRFAVKEFRRDQHSLWQDEFAALERFSGPRTGHYHLINLLFAYEHTAHGYFLVFPLAEGSLADYWENTSHLTSGPYWLIEQCRGIANALRKIHHHDSWPDRHFGRHGDIKPENVLWFKNPNTKLVVADFTLTRFHNPDTLAATAIGGRGYSMTYRAPEISLDSLSSSPQSYDVWGLGCLYLEFISWYLFGNAALGRKKAPAGKRGQSYQPSSDFTDDSGQPVQNFSDARIGDDDRRLMDGAPEDKFFNVNSDEHSSRLVVKKSVQEWIEYLHRSPRCSKALHEFLDLIECSMLLVDPGDRYNMERISSRLAAILEESRDDTYCNQGVPRPGQDGRTDPPERKMANTHINVDMNRATAANSEADLEAISEALDNRHPTDPSREVDHYSRNSSQEEDGYSTNSFQEQNIRSNFENSETVLFNQSAEGEFVTSHREGCLDLLRYNLRHLWETLRRIA